MSDTLVVLITLISYKVVLLGVGWWASKRVSDESDYFLAGGGLGPWTAGLSYAASTSSAWVLLGFTGMVFTQGVVGLWLVPGIFGGYLMTWLVMGPRLNAETAAKGHITIVDFITEGLAPKAKRVTGLVCAALILFCFVFYISSQFQAAGNALGEVFGLSIAEAVIIGAVVIVIYCALGGFWAASITDALQAGVMMLACVLVPLATVMAAGGFGSVIETLHATQDHDYFSFTNGAAGMAGIGLAMGLLGTGLGALGQPQLLNRIMAVRSDGERKKAAAITIGWGVVIYSGLICLAFAARALNVDTGGESLFFAAAQQFLPPVLAGVVIAAVLSAVMSTVDSLLLAAASAVSHDSGVTYVSPKRALMFGRLAMVGVAVFAVILTLALPQEIFSRVLFAWVALGAGFGPVILVKCLGWTLRDGAVLLAILAGFTIAVIAYNIDGPVAEVVEKWVSWLVGLIILFIGRVR
ncbi:sodium/proline symporter [Litorimonas sp. WD9-15]|uniref:sodium/proline symporter n=1 Tax=Litorimonas sp. WD9-15 TaxID=3418716 RepID=UPI003D076F7E